MPATHGIPGAPDGRATAAPAAPASDPVRAIAEAVLYEGYVLWPYRRSAMKNRQRFTFGGIYPDGWSRAHGDRTAVRTECLLETEPAVEVDVEVRFLHVVARRPLRRGPHGLEPVDELDVDGQPMLAWDEAAERTVAATGLSLAALEAGRRVPIEVPTGRRDEATGDGVVSRRWEALHGVLAVRATRLAPSLVRLHVTVTNTTPWQGGGREATLRQTLASTHVVLRARRGAFVSQTDPPPALRVAAEACQNDGLWPVLVGAPGERRTVLASPIILEDHPRIAPESPGDGFDASEIDQLLVLSVLSLTDAERREVAGTDPRTRELLARTEALSPDAIRRLHGAIRECRVLRNERP